MELERFGCEGGHFVYLKNLGWRSQSRLSPSDT